MINIIYQRLISLLLIIAMMWANTQIVLAATSLQLNDFTIKVNTWSAISWAIYANPWDILSILLSWENNGDTASNVEAEFTFSDTQFSYYEPWTIGSYVMWLPVNSNIATTDFNPPTDNTAPITTSSANWDYLDLYYLKLQLNNTITATNFNIWAKFTATSFAWSNEITRPIYVNTRPHITDYSFSASSLKNDGNGSVNLTVKVKDYNWCGNIDWWMITADLSQLGLSNLEPLTYNSCESDGYTAVFVKNNIQTTTSTWDKTFDPASFIATDEDGNTNLAVDPDTEFDIDDKQSTITLTVAPSTYPVVTISNTSDTSIWTNEPATPDSVITFSADQVWDFKVVINWNWDCSSGTVPLGYDWWSYTVTWASATANINASDLNDWVNTIYVCIQNSLVEIGSANTIITKDSTSPTISNIWTSPASVVTGDSSITFTCNEDWFYKVCHNTPTTCVNTVTDWTATTANTENSSAVTNWILALWSNDFTVYCRDNAYNETSYTWATVTRVAAPPSMTWATITLADNDTSWDWVDGRDISVSWDTSNGEWFTWFESWRVYLLPTSSAYNTWHTYIELNATASEWNFTWAEALTTDSSGTTLITWDYQACVAIMWQSGDLWEIWCSSAATLTWDVVLHPNVLSAKFTSDTNLEITTDTTLKTDITQHTWTYVTFEMWWTTYSWTDVASIDWKKLNITVASLNNTAATWSNLLLQTWAIRWIDWWYNDYFSSGSLIVTDSQLPTIDSFTQTVSPVYTSGSWASFYSWSIAFSYSFSEEMNTWWTVYLEITRESWSSDVSTYYDFITNPTELTSWAHTHSIDISTLWLVSWACYQARMVGQDTSWNSNGASYTWNICLDTWNPDQVTTISYPNSLNEDDNYTSSTTPTLTWFTGSDNENESWIWQYQIQASVDSSFSISFIDAYTWSTSYVIWSTLSNWTYYWRVRAYDNMSNSWSWATTKDFIVDDSVPTVSDMTLNSISRWTSSITHESWGNVISLTASITNSTWWCITADFSPLGWSTGLTVDSYSANVATWTWFTVSWSTADWLKNIIITAQNANCVWSWTWEKNITIDSTVPVIWTGITFPLSWDFITWSWTSTIDITWNTASITENNFDYATLDYYDWGAWNQIATSLTNNWQYTWDAPVLDITTAQIRITIRDKAGHTTTQTWTAFTIDSTDPVVSSSAITYPSWWESFKWSDGITITWSWVLITETNLSSTWISLYYSSDNGSNWTLIASWETDDWSYSWTSPADTNSTSMRIKLVALDKAWNTGYNTNAWVFTVDSVNPTISTRQSQDLDWDGKIDAIKVTFSESITDANVNTAEFWLNWYTISGFTSTLNWDTANNEIIYLSLTEISWTCSISDQTWCDTNVVPVLTYTAWTLTDIAWNSLSSNSLAITDNATPVILWRKTIDTDWNWQLDSVEITFSENMDASQVVSSSYQITTSWDQTLTESYGDSTDDKTLLLTFTDWTAFDTADLTKSKIVANDFMDLSWNYVTQDSSFVSATVDWANPVFRSNTQEFNSQSQIKIEFSENVTITSNWTWSVWDSVSISSLFWTWSNYMTFNVSNITDTWITPSLTYQTQWTILDSTWNNASTWTIITSDSIVPQVSSITILDSNTNWNIDTAQIQFSETINDSTINYSEYSIWWILGTSFSTWTWSNDSIIEISISSEISWTLIQDVIYTQWTTKDVSANSLWSITALSIEEIDWAGPAIVSVNYLEWATVANDQMIINFSENINDSSLSISDFSVSLWWSITNWTLDSQTANDKQVVIQMSASDTRLTVWTSKIAFAWAWVVSDLANWKTNTQTSQIIVNGAVIINEINWAWSSANSQDEWIELKNMSSSSVDISWWTLQMGTNITIPSSSTIAANWYFLVSNYAETDWSSKLNVTPDFVTTSLSLTDTNNWNIILKDSWWNSVDSAIWTTWPYWSSSYYSMERNANPWDWLTESNWYTAVSSLNLDSWWSEKWTPGTWNVIDAIPPSINLDSRLPSPDALIPWNSDIYLSFTDTWVWVDTANTKMFLDWDSDTSTSTWWTNWCETYVSRTFISSSYISVSPSAALPAWRNRACIIVTDNAWNETNTYWDFWVDNLTMSITEVSPASLEITPTIDAELSWASKITITTYWAWINLTWNFSELISWSNNITNSEIQYDSKLDKNSVQQHTYDWYLTSSGSATIETISKVSDLQSDSWLKTYEIYMKYKIGVSAIKPAWVYTWSVIFWLETSY